MRIVHNKWMSPSTASPKNHVFGANMVAQQANLPPSYTGVSYWCCFVSSNSTEPLFLSTHSSYFCFITIILKYLKIKILNVGTHFSTLHMFLACRRSAPPPKNIATMYVFGEREVWRLVSQIYSWNCFGK